MFGVSMTEFMVVAVVALLVLGPDKLPQIASQLGKISFQLKKTSDAFKREFYNSVYKPAEENTGNLRAELRSVGQNLITTASTATTENVEARKANPDNKENENA